ncbi:MAG TPA: beta-galactosidase GalA [Opitutaceae bacterium]|nr:beta-galactosidase GalA [Opitutaceae bacterium]
MDRALVHLVRRSALCGLLVLAALAICASASAESPRERLTLDANWRFHLGDVWPDSLRLDKAGVSAGPAAPDFSDAGWRVVDVPHDWAVELPFDPAADRNHGYKALGAKYPENSIAWYRRSFEVPASDADRRIWLTFDGVFRDATVWVNGWLVRRHESGYSPLREDITDVLNFGGRNTIAVRVDATKSEGWFYEGAGIYRHVWLEKTAPLAIAPDGVFVHSEFPDNRPTGAATIRLRTTLLNKLRTSAAVEVRWQVVTPDGAAVAEGNARKTAEIAAGATADLVGQARVHAPALWSPETPQLYRLVTSIFSEGRLVDRQETEFGIRTVGFDPNIGFLLNGRRYEIHGTCNHQDHAGVGVAMPDALQEFRVKRLKEMGSNAYRTAHNPPTPELLEICDRLGMLVMDEGRLLGSDSENLRKWEELIRRDRNHPSVFIWSIANEELAVHDTPQAGRVAQTMQDLAKRLDPTRPVTYAANEKNVFLGINAAIEVRGWNYHLGAHVDDYHREHPRQPIVGSEQGSVVGTRGVYANDYERGRVNALDIVWPGWDTTAESWWTFFAERPWLSGAFVWTGFDYRGEPSPCNWPSISSHFGILDTCGFPKDSFYYYKSWWTGEPVLHLAPHWNWPGKEGQEIPVQALSNCAEVELFLNGISQGRQSMKRLSKLFWPGVKYEPGVLSAKGYDALGNVVAEAKVETTGDATQLRLTPDRTTVDADGRDIALFTVAALDARGRVVPLAQNKVEFALEGAARIIGVGNGDPNCHEPDVFIGSDARWSRSLFNGLAQIIVQSACEAGEFKLTARAHGLAPAAVTLKAQPTTSRPSVP